MCLDEYAYYNFYLGGGTAEKMYYFDYESCIEEVNSINKILQNKEKTSNLIDGL